MADSRYSEDSGPGPAPQVVDNTTPSWQKKAKSNRGPNRRERGDRRGQRSGVSKRAAIEAGQEDENERVSCGERRRFKTPQSSMDMGSARKE